MPDKLSDLDLDAFAEELERQDYGNKKTTLYDIRNELFAPFKERRDPYTPMTEVLALWGIVVAVLVHNARTCTFLYMYTYVYTMYNVCVVLKTAYNMVYKMYMYMYMQL